MASRRHGTVKAAKAAAKARRKKSPNFTGTRKGSKKKK